MNQSDDSPTFKKKIANPCVLIIFGITGDLIKRSLYPAICNLGSNGLLNKNFHIVGIAMEKYSTKSFREQLKKDTQKFITDPAAKAFSLLLLKNIHYISGSFADFDVFDKLQTTLKKLENKKASKNYIFYFASPPKFFATIFSGLNKAKLFLERDGNYFRRLMLEKPFGTSYASSKELNQKLLRFTSENQLYRIDHYLGKEMLQNLLAFRFSNAIFEPIWNSQYIDHVQITIAEKIGVELRGASYDRVGALRDMTPSHLIQMLSLVAMEPPRMFESNAICDEKTKAIAAIKIFTKDEATKYVIRGQYGSGNIDDVAVPGYRSEPNVDPHSLTETFVALKLFVDNDRWRNVPFYLRTGKRLPTRTTEIAIQFKKLPPTLFGAAGKDSPPNLLRIKVQPEQSILFYFNAKIPGPPLQLTSVDMSFKYNDYFESKSQTGYESILYDCMNGDHTLFRQAEMVEQAWAVLQPILDNWEITPPALFPNYASGTWGPKEADKLLAKDGRKWIL